MQKNLLVTMEMTGGYLQQSRPMCYVQDTHWLVSVGDEITTLKELEDLLLFDTGMEGMYFLFIVFGTLRMCS